MKKILVLSCHPDDMELSCGATIKRLIDEGKHVKVLCFSYCRKSAPLEGSQQIYIEWLKSMDFYGVDHEMHHFPVREFNRHSNEIRDILFDFKNDFDTIFTLSTQDIHEDHETLTKEACRVFKYSTIMGAELAWNNLEYNNRAFFEITKEQLEFKIKALEIYKTQTQLGRHYFKRESIEGLARVRGMQIAKEYAESFEVIRQVW